MATSAQQRAANKRFEFVSRAFGEDKFSVVKMSGFESISKPFRFTLTLVSNDADIDFDKVLQNPAEFRIYAPDGASSTPYHGMIAAFEQLHKSDGYVFYQAVLVPRLWQLSLYQVSEVYLDDQPIPDTVKKVLEQSRLSSADFEFKLSGSYRNRSYVCQYQETHLDFLSRWMEKEGMYFYFDHEGRNDKLVIADNRSMHAAAAVKVLYRPVDEQDTGAAGDSVQDFVCRQEPLPKQVVLRDFNHRKAHIELKATAPVSDNGVGEINIYGENFRDEEEGKRYAKLRAEEILCGARVFSGEATAVGLRSGYFMEMDRHYRGNFNGRYLVTEVQHEGSQAAALLTGGAGAQGEGGETRSETNYRTSFRAIPAATQFRPKRSTAKPKVIGTMNAIIDAAGMGPYAELDAYGQYKVQLPFDNSDKNAGKGSARVRMASPYAGSDHGMNFPLQKNAEVLLSFVDGDPDQPVILGAVPNSENPSVVNYKNPEVNRITTRGGNQLQMNDTRGGQSVQLHSPAGMSSIFIGSFGPGAAKHTPEEAEKERERSEHKREENEKKREEKDKEKEDKEKSAASNGLKFITTGVSEALTIGVKTEATIGASQEIKIAGESKIGVGFSSSMALDFGLAAKFGGAVELGAANSYGVETGKSYKLGEQYAEQASQKITMSAGYTDDEGVYEAAFDKLKNTAANSLKAITAVNTVLALGAAGTLMGTQWDETNEPGHEYEHKGWRAGATVGSAVGVSMIASALTYSKLRDLIKGLLEKYEHMRKVSVMELDRGGIKQTVNGDAANVLMNIEKDRGVTLNVETVGANGAFKGGLHLNQSGLSYLRAAHSLRLLAPTVAIGHNDQATRKLVGLKSGGDVVEVSSTASLVGLNGANVVIAGGSVEMKVASRAAIPSRVLPEEVASLQAQAAELRQSVTALTGMLAREAGTFALHQAYFGRPHGDFTNWTARLAHATADLALAEAAVVQAQATVTPPAGPLEGFSVKTGVGAVMQFGNAGIKASDTGLGFKFGTAATMDFQPSLLKIDGTMIQLG